MICRVFPFAVPDPWPDELLELDELLEDPPEPSSGYSMSFARKYRHGTGGIEPDDELLPELPDEWDEELDDELDDELEEPAQQAVYWYCRRMIGSPDCPFWIISALTNVLAES